MKNLNLFNIDKKVLSDTAIEKYAQEMLAPSSHVNGDSKPESGAAIAHAVANGIGKIYQYTDILRLADKIMPRTRLIKLACDCTLINVELIRPFASEFEFIVAWLHDPAPTRSIHMSNATAAAADAAISQVLDLDLDLAGATDDAGNYSMTAKDRDRAIRLANAADAAHDIAYTISDVADAAHALAYTLFDAIDDEDFFNAIDASICAASSVVNADTVALKKRTDQLIIDMFNEFK